ncbi:MAG: SUMF1/EgtB/PvdO family nonheme iron enzyme [Candidatus Sumerlaeia bacterium]
MNREILNGLIGLSPVVGLFLKVTLILGLGWVLHFLLARANPRWRVLLWRAVAVGVLLVPLIASMMPAFELAMPQPAPPAEPPAPVVNDQIPAEPAVQPAIPAAAPVAAAPVDVQPLDFVSGHPWLSGFVLYAIVCAAFALKLALSLRRVRRVLTGSTPTDPIILEKLHEIRSLLGVRRFVDLRASSALSSPFLYGLRRPVIILPERMTQGDYAKELPGIFVHELAHLQGRDLAWMNIIHFVSIALWFHPLAWRMRAAHAASCEAVCDAVAAEHVGSALNYSRTLARIALELVALPPAVGGIPMARMPEIRRRLELLKMKIHANPLARRWAATAIVLGYAALSLIVGIKLVSAESAPTERTVTVKLPQNVTMELIQIPAGSFQMGRTPGDTDKFTNEKTDRPREDPRHQVTIKSNFYLGKTEVTKAQWEAVTGTKPWAAKIQDPRNPAYRPFVIDDPNSPAVCVSWDDIAGGGGFIDKLNAYLMKSGQGQVHVRLPSEAEWEYACRAGTTTRFYWGDGLPPDTQIAAHAWYDGNAGNLEPYAHAVGQKQPNAWGLFDMAGNVSELCQDRSHDDYTGAPSDGSAWVKKPYGAYREMRGGHFLYPALGCCAANRDVSSEDYRGIGVGFRLAANGRGGVETDSEPVPGDLMPFLVARNEASKEKIENVSYAFDMSFRRYSGGGRTTTTSGEVIKNGDSVRSTYRQGSGEIRFVANDQYIAFVNTQFANAQWYDYPTTQSRMTKRIAEARSSHTPSNADIQLCFGLPRQSLREMVAVKNIGIRHEAVETKDESGRRIYQLRRFKPGMKDPNSPQAVWVIDPDKGYLITGMTSYHEDGSVWTKNSFKLKEVSDGAWFPVEFSETYNTPQLQYERSMTISDIKLNPPVDKSQFAVEALDLKSLNPAIVFLRTEADGTKSIYTNENGKLVKADSPDKPARQAAPAAAELTGTVTGPNHQPVKGALIYIYEELMEHYDPAKPLERGDKGKYVYTDAQGGFKIPALTPGYMFQVLVMADGFAPELIDKANPKSGALQITLKPEPDQMKPGHTVFGKVVDQDGKPLPGVQVRDLKETRPNGSPKFYTSNRNVIFPIAITDRDGNFAIRSNEADVSMWLDFESPNMTKLAARDVKTSVEVQVFKMSPGATVTGKVIDDGKPVAGVRIQLAGMYRPEHPDTWTGFGVSDKDGNFVFEHVAAGREYRLSSVISSPKMIADRTVNVAADARRIDVGAIQTVPASSLFKLSGKVELSDGKPIPKGAKLLVQRRMGEGVDAELGADGRFEFKGLPVDTYSITPMRIPGYVLSKKNDHDAVGGFAPRAGSMDPATKKIDRDTNMTVLLEPGEATPVYVVTSSDGTITAMASGNQPEPKPFVAGTVVSDKGEPIKGALVYVYLAGYKNPNFNGAHEYPDIGKRERTDGQGRFTIRSLRPDQYFGVLAMADGYAPKYIYKVESLAAPLTFKLEPDAERYKPGHVVRGKVVGPDGKPLAGVVVETTAVERKMAGGMFSVQAASGDLKVDPIAITDGQGEFRITSPDTNFKVNLRMRAPGLAELAAGKLSPGEDVHVFKLAQGATVVGRVLDHGKPVPDAVVDLNLIPASTSDTTMVMGSQSHVKTDADGNFVFANAKSGLTYFISCRMISIKERGAVKVRSVRVEHDGDRVDAGVLEIEPGFSLSGRVDLSDGKPVPADARVMIIGATSRDAQFIKIGPDGRFEFKGLPPDVYEITPHIEGYMTSQNNVHDPLPGPMLPMASGWGVAATRNVDRDVKDLRVLVEPGEMKSYTVRTSGEPSTGTKPITFTAPGQ